MFFSKLFRSWRLKKLQKLEQELVSVQMAYESYNKMTEVQDMSRITWYAWTGVTFYLNKIADLEEKIDKLRLALGQNTQEGGA
jgi:hypothetical protein